MKNSRKRRAEHRARQFYRASKKKITLKNERTAEIGTSLHVNEERLAPYSSYGVPDFVMRGSYLDRPFRCASCGSQEIWTAAQQKWWYEVAKGYVYSTAKLCRSCRKREQERRNRARREHLEGLARKKVRK